MDLAGQACRVGLQVPRGFGVSREAMRDAQDCHDRKELLTDKGLQDQLLRFFRSRTEGSTVVECLEANLALLTDGLV